MPKGRRSGLWDTNYGGKFLHPVSCVWDTGSVGSQYWKRMGNREWDALPAAEGLWKLFFLML